MHFTESVESFLYLCTCRFGRNILYLYVLLLVGMLTSCVHLYDAALDYEDIPKEVRDLCYQQFGKQALAQGSADLPEPLIAITEETLVINGVDIPCPSRRSHLEAALGLPDKVHEKPFGTQYTYDQLGITYRTDVDDDTVSGIILFLKDKTYKYSFAPAHLFSGTVRVRAVVFPRTNIVECAMMAIPEIKSTTDFGAHYQMTLGKRRLSLFVDHGNFVEWSPRKGEIQQIHISLSPPLSNEELEKRVKAFKEFPRNQ